jgi:penicillin-binding protein-related factor A (putative recombinase)
MAQPERKVKSEIRKILNEIQAYYVPIIVTAAIPKGTPDFIGCINGKFFGVEAKATTRNLPTQYQQRRLDAIEKAGGIPLVIHEGNLKELYKLCE